VIDPSLIRSTASSIAVSGTRNRSTISDIRHALIDEAWFGRSRAPSHVDHRSLGWELSDEARAERNSEDPFGHRWSAADEKRRAPERDQAQELDFDR